MLGGTEVNGAGKLASDGNQASRQVGAWYWRGVPGIDKKQDGLKCHSDRLLFIGYDAQAFVQEEVHTLNQLAVMVSASPGGSYYGRGGTPIYLRRVDGLRPFPLALRFESLYTASASALIRVFSYGEPQSFTATHNCRFTLLPVPT